MASTFFPYAAFSSLYSMHKRLVKFIRTNLAKKLGRYCFCVCAKMPQAGPFLIAFAAAAIFVGISIHKIEEGKA